MRKIFYRIDEDAIILLGVERKKTRTTPKQTIDRCQQRLAAYDDLVRDSEPSP